MDLKAPPHLWVGCVGTFLDGQMEARRFTLAQDQAMSYLNHYALGEEIPNNSSTFADDAKLSRVMKRHIICDRS